MITSIFLTAAVLGVTHGIEPDHAAGILSLTSESGDSWLAAGIGACFAIGHVVLVAAWIVIAQLFLQTTSFPAVIDSAGTVVLGGVLVMLGVMIGVLGRRKLVHTHEHSHGDGDVHRHRHLHLPFAGNTHFPSTTAAHTHDHSTLEYLRISVVGALFTLSPPLSMMAFIAIVLAEADSSSIAAVLGVYGVAIVLTMATIGGGIGFLFSFVRERGQRIHALAQLSASVLIVLYGCYFLWQAVP